MSYFFDRLKKETEGNSNFNYNSLDWNVGIWFYNICNLISKEMDENDDKIFKLKDEIEDIKTDIKMIKEDLDEILENNRKFSSVFKSLYGKE